MGRKARCKTGARGDVNSGGQSRRNRNGRRKRRELRLGSAGRNKLRYSSQEICPLFQSRRLNRRRDIQWRRYHCARILEADFNSAASVTDGRPENKRVGGGGLRA